ncbi:HK97-gp10 family putative phage morphogenesis protein [Dehalococcoides mccartyi]|jgi:phage protein, HK97 gp10 family|uniref:HK97-gp10 family putative phage morphogenesis protein n=1 Tax=Dehalococcoides mccartyi TaxID=61435 RepID=UPI00098F8096|nr:HK97-gp10 family putative phage morphogenesis protein [Dehalococcoides mccartyi]AQU06105.1 hypothetical protein B1777_05320 [Dehalococcoides mccartyi]AQU07548.1 hypothetical protein B1778_05120 [Dehalococcoides mccartyi]AQX74794.1 hypothetical protein B1776_04415 [Dehalococcoides mccartyi]AQY73371.1 hypothetical protein B1772_04725 [Dehalococcoides mccartyi]QBX64071.1 HK97 gp10 family phage protein [Dehalococcoides mccartyi]
MQIKLEGQAELQQTILKLSKSVQSDKVEPILFDAAKMVKTEIKSRVPIDTGRLKKAVIAKKLKRRDNYKPAPSIAGIDRKKAPHAHIVEFGSAGRYAKKGKHKGRYFGPMPAKPYFRPAWDTTRDKALNQIKTGLEKQIESVAK